ncbi:uncharacterized protein BYT42DRAFT_609089 [Radiomyces spectabilis]|uniref:uncharacterized protein n=1 Tax=Radiomyces spectabilis TaxID=64574 RepID=UPI00221EC02B|nr:uncharacterized protein BYT42DRAFT_609089 [Radiomyces spectabilis]KAI8393291.1 hypothetical protein BYT42DRAFT_609089 [Radiomyces spectabilis]
MPVTRTTRSGRFNSSPEDVLPLNNGNEAPRQKTPTKKSPDRSEGRSKMNAEYKDLLLQFIHILQRTDKEESLQTANAITLNDLRSNLEADKYANVSEFKNELDQVFISAVQGFRLDRTKIAYVEQLYRYAVSTLQLETRRMKRKLSQTGDDDADQIKYDESIAPRKALFRSTPDGFVFTDATICANDTENHAQILPANVEEMLIHSTPADMYEVPTLRSTVALPPRFPPKTFKHEDKPVIGIQWLDYGAFSSFAPACDSRNANVSYESTYMGRAAKRFKKWERKQRNLQKQGKLPLLPKHASPTTSTPHSNDSPNSDKEGDANGELDTAWLKQQDLDVDTILHVAEGKSAKVDDVIVPDPANVEAILERNNQLLRQLLQRQEHRFSLGDVQWTNIDDTELETAKVLQSKISELMAKVPPKDLITPDEIQSAMERLPLLETAYRGNLPPNKIFAFPTTDKIEPLPPYANITPTYQKERWRLIDVGPIPPRSNTTTTTTHSPAGPVPSPSFAQQPSSQPQPSFMNSAVPYLTQQQVRRNSGANMISPSPLSQVMYQSSAFSPGAMPTPPR